jgi:type I phosphodiesterase/nucleotide pyrophosphatase
MNSTRGLRVTVPALALLLACSAAFAQSSSGNQIKRVMLISIDGMHSIDFANCSAGIGTINGGKPYCPYLAELSNHGVHYVQALTPRPSDSFPGLTALITGGTPRSAGMYYDVNYDRKLSPPFTTTPYGILGGPALCPSVIGTQVGLDEEIDYNYQKLDAGKLNGPSGITGINPDYLPRDPNNNCAPVYPHSYIRVNTIFNVVKNGGGYTAWSDKHPSYDFTNGPTGDGVVDLWSPEINSIPVPIPTVLGCDPLPDPGAAQSTNAWTDSFQNIRCYDHYKVQAVLNWIKGKTHDGTTTAPVPNLFGMNFQAVSVGQKLVEPSISQTGGYVDALGTPSSELLGEIEFADSSIGELIAELQKQSLYDSTLIIITAKHGQSPVDLTALLRIPADNPLDQPPSQILSPTGVGPGLPVAQADEDDVSMLWLTDQTQTAADVATLSANRSLFGGGEIFAGNSLKLSFPDPLVDSRVPDIIVAPNVGVVYTGGQAKVSEHGGFAYDDRNVLLIVSNSSYSPSTYTSTVETRQVAPTIVQALGYQPSALQAVQQEGTEVLPGLPFTSSKQ